MSDTRACIAEGEHVRSTRHLPASCPMSDQPLPRTMSAEEDVTVRYLLVELPIRASLADPEDAHDGIQTDVRMLLDEHEYLAERPKVTQVYPGDVVAPDATPDRDQSEG